VKNYNSDSDWEIVTVIHSCSCVHTTCLFVGFQSEWISTQINL